MNRLDKLVKDRFCKCFQCEWYLKENPTYYYDLWSRYLCHGNNIKYPWDYRRYLQQKEADMWHAKCVYGFYLEFIDKKETNINELQLTINFIF